MRILFLLEQLAVGGAEWYFVRKAEWFQRRGHRVWVASGGGRLEGELERAGIPHLTLPAVSQFVPLPTSEESADTVRRLRDLILREQIGVIDALPIKPFIYGYAVSKELKVPIILETISSIYFVPPAYRQAVLDVAQAGRLYAMGEEEAVASGLQVGIDPRLFQIIPLGVDTRRFTPKASHLREEIGVGKDAILVVSTSRLDQDKVTYVSYLLEDVAFLQPSFPSVHLVIVGDGTLRSKLEAKARDLGLRNVHWLGTRLDTDQLYPGADIFVGMGTAALEAAAAGLPVIVASVRSCRPPFASRSDVAVYYFGTHSKRSIGHDIPGLPRSSFAALLEPLLRDRLLRERLGAQGREIVRAEFNVDSVNLQWEAAFMRAIRSDVTPISAAKTASIDVGGPAVRVGELLPIRRVLFVNRPDTFSVPGGDTVQMMKTKEALERRGIQVDVSLSLTPDAKGYDIAHLFNIQIPSVQLQQIRSLKKSGVPVVVSPIFWDHSELMWALLAIRAAFGSHAIDLQAALDGLANRTLVVNGRTPFTPFPRGREYHQQQREIIETADVVLPNSLAEARMLQHSLGVTDFPFIIVPNGVDSSMFLRARPDEFVRKYGKRDFVLTAARWDDRKNLVLLFMAMSGLGIPFVIVGNTTCDASYTQLARAYLPTGALVVEHMSQEELASAYAAARVHVLPSWFETPGLASMEAAVAGCSIVVGNRGSEIEYFQADAYYCDPANVQSIRQAILAAWNNYERDAQRRARLRDRIIRDYSWDRAADATISGYQMALEKRGKFTPHRTVFPTVGTERQDTRAHPHGSFHVIDPDDDLSPSKSRVSRACFPASERAVDGKDRRVLVYEASGSLASNETEVAGNARHTHKEENIIRLHRSWMDLVGSIRPRLERVHERKERPAASVIIVTHNSLRTIARCLESVLSTLQGSDEVIVVDNASQDETPRYLSLIAEQELRHLLTIHLCRENMGYAGAAAKAARLARNQFLVFLNPDTVVYDGWIEGLLAAMSRAGEVAASGPVSNYAAGLQNVARYLENIPQEVSIDWLRSRLREGWSERTVETRLLIGFCLAVRRDVFEAVGGFDESLFLGNDDLDLSWRLSKAGYKQVVVPSVFVFHHGQASFRTEPQAKTAYLVQQSTNQLYEKLYTAYSGAVPSPQDLWGIEWFRPQADLVSVIVPVRHGPSVTRRCLESLVRHTHRAFEVIIVDNDADPETKDVIDDFARGHDHVTVIRNAENVGYPVACNQGMARARGEYLVVMNNDVVVTPHWASRLLAALSVDPKLGAVGPRTNFVAGPQLVEGASYTEESLDAWAEEWFRKNAGSLRLTMRLIGFLMMIKREVIEQIGGFDPLFGVGNFEDDDFSLRAQLAGYKLAIADDVFVHHYGSQSFRQAPSDYARLMEVNRRLFAAKWEVAFESGGYNPGTILQRSGYRRSELYVPLAYEAIFLPQGEKLDVGLSAERVLLCVPDPSDGDGAWLRFFEHYLKAARNGVYTGLVIWVEPADPAWLEHVVSSMRGIAEQLGVDLDTRDDIVVEARRVFSAERGAVYRAATHFVSLPGVRQESLAREARACGLQVVDGSSVVTGLHRSLQSLMTASGRDKQ